MPSLLASLAAFGVNRPQPAVVADVVMVLNAIRDDGCGSSQPDLRAGILADGSVTVSERGTGQGSVASPLHGNTYGLQLNHRREHHWKTRHRQENEALSYLQAR